MHKQQSQIQNPNCWSKNVIANRGLDSESYWRYLIDHQATKLGIQMFQLGFGPLPFHSHVAIRMF